MSSPTDPSLPAEVAAWIGRVVVTDEGGFAVERGMIESFAAAVEDANPLYWDDQGAGGCIAPPAALSAWVRPASWSPNGAPRRPLELHFLLKEKLDLSKAVVTGSDTIFQEPVRAGDRVRSEQVLEEVSAVIENRLGRGRRWTIAIRYYRQDGVSLGVEQLRFFAYGSQADAA